MEAGEVDGKENLEEPKTCTDSNRQNPGIEKGKSCPQPQSVIYI